MQPETRRYTATQLVTFTKSLFEAAGFDEEKARTTAEILVEADLMGHTTHGLALAPEYLDELEAGAMSRTGAPVVVEDRGATLVWDGLRLPGVWLTARALALACHRARQFGICAVAIRNSHHIACLAAYLLRATEQGLMAIIASSDPSVASVAPFGGTRPVFTPNPLAAGIPTAGDPILIDTSASITTNGLSARLREEGRRYPGLWAVDAQGTPTDDPNVLVADPPGTILPAGGMDHGHKGYALALLVEALTQGLGGFGRAEQPSQWGASVFVQVLDPAAFAGLAAFTAETEWIASACRNSAPLPGVRAVRLPGQAALARRRAALAEGVQLYPGILAGLEKWAAKFGIPLPAGR
ncbi:MAG: Ldh family oxidoreductase [Caldilineaceae bacterium]|nr:Ldh family oxidoreductase [Caldilineaceae bacterium]